MSDREQIRRDAEAVKAGANLVEAEATLADGRKVPLVQRDERLRKTWHVLFNCECRHDQTAHEAVRELDALLAELEQAERERDDALKWAGVLSKALNTRLEEK